jgi:hypothetical protein
MSRYSLENTSSIFRIDDYRDDIDDGWYTEKDVKREYYNENFNDELELSENAKNEKFIGFELDNMLANLQEPSARFEIAEIMINSLLKTHKEAKLLLLDHFLVDDKVVVIHYVGNDHRSRRRFFTGNDFIEACKIWQFYNKSNIFSYNI